MSNKGYITLDPKHGINPVIPKCFICTDKDCDCIVLAGNSGLNPNGGMYTKGLDPSYICKDCAEDNDGLAMLICHGCSKYSAILTEEGTETVLSMHPTDKDLDGIYRVRFGDCNWHQEVSDGKK